MTDIVERSSGMESTSRKNPPRAKRRRVHRYRAIHRRRFTMYSVVENLGNFVEDCASLNELRKRLGAVVADDELWKNLDVAFQYQKMSREHFEAATKRSNTIQKKIISKRKKK